LADLVKNHIIVTMITFGSKYLFYSKSNQLMD